MSIQGIELFSFHGDSATKTTYYNQVGGRLGRRSPASYYYRMICQGLFMFCEVTRGRKYTAAEPAPQIA